MTRKGSPQWG